jgi:hypothetical protein
MPDSIKSRFEEEAKVRRQRTFVSELWQFVSHNRRWWMIPILVAVLLFGILLVLGGTGIAPFIYTLF